MVERRFVNIFLTDSGIRMYLECDLYTRCDNQGGYGMIANVDVACKICERICERQDATIDQYI